MSSTLLFQRNWQIPRASGVIDRPRLLSQLQGATTHKLTLICAPPGYGKTTIAAQFADHAPYPVAWQTLEERERDIPTLYNQSLVTLEQIAPGIQNLAPVPGYTASELATLIADYLRAQITQPAIYVLDDIHLLAGSPAAEAWLQTLVAMIPATCHLILVGRILPNLPLTEMIARGEVLALGQEQLRFTPDEIYTLARESVYSQPSWEDVEALAERLEGWPAGTVLALHPLPADLERTLLNGGQGPEALFQALANSMLTAQPPGLTDFLLDSSTLSHMTPELCSVVLNLADSAYWLTEAQNRNLFLSKVAGGLVYHRLFRDFLQQKLKLDDPDRLISLHGRAARWFEQNNRIDEGFDHYMSAGLIERAAAISDRAAEAYFAQGRVETLLKWRARLGQIGIFAPSLLYNCARVHTDRYNYEAAEIALSEAERGYVDQNDHAGLADVQLQWAMIRLQRGDYQAAAWQAIQLVESHGRTRNVQGRALKILGVASMRLGEVEKAAHYLEEALPLHREDGDAYTLANVLQDLGVTYERSGRLKDASACLQEVVALRRSLGSASALALALNNLGFYYHLSGDYDQALSTLQEGLSVVARVPNKRAESYLLWSIGDLYRDRGAFDEAMRFYHKALELIGLSEPSLRAAILISAATLRRWQNRLSDAASLAESTLALAAKHGLALEAVTAQANLWTARAQTGDPGQALGHLRDVVTSLNEQGERFELVRVSGLCAHVALRCGQPAIADRYLQSGLDLAKEVGSTQPLVTETLHTPLLDAHVRQSLVASRAFKHDLKCLRDAQIETVQADHQLPQMDPNVTYSLRVLTLGYEIIERDGHVIPLPDWRSNTAREMFLYLLFQGPKTRERISLAFWPDSPPKRVRSNFHTTLYRARQALGEETITFQDGLYMVSPDISLWCDAQEMESLTQQARLLPSRDARTEDLWHRAVSLYRGEFLPSWDAEWAALRREALEEAYLEALIGLGECARARHGLKEAVATFKRALDVDPYREDVHRAIMSCYAESGEKNQILSHLKKLKDLLRHDLAIEPSEETLALAQTLLR